MFSVTPRPPIRRVPLKPRDPARTRERLLQCAFQHVYRSGFRGTDIDTIIESAGMTKGALYHHFTGKEALGYAIVDEVITNITLEKWVKPLENPADPISAIAQIIQSSSMTPDHLRGGCPLNNLAQEMSPLDEGFRKRIDAVFTLWHGAVAGALRNGQKRHLVRTDIDADETATFLIAAYEGYMSLTKSSQDARMLQSGKKSITRYLDSLRAPGRKHNRRTNV
jgi:TetR/AcrR family transcriptional regulator, transcriptional repressor for nem operon